MSCTPTAAEMAQLRADVANIALDLDCVIQRATTSKDAWGTETETWATIATLKAGMRSPKPATLDVYASRIGAKLAWEVNFTYGTDVQEQDHLLIGSETMVVQAVLSVQSYSTLTTVLATETK